MSLVACRTRRRVVDHDRKSRVANHGKPHVRTMTTSTGVIGARTTALWCRVLAVALTGACSGRPPNQYPDAVTVESRVLFERADGVDVRNGGYGSALAAAPGRPGFFYLLVDRGPNIDTARSDEKAFVVPEFVPHIGLFELEGSSLKRVSVIEMKDASGGKLSGLPNARGDAHDVERAVDINGTPLPRDPKGIDPEGMAVLEDRTFWISEEYGPSLLHLDSSGREVERLSPFEKDAKGRSLPRVLARRRLTFGIEGLAVTPDGNTLVAVMQSALDNPDRDVRSATRSTRIVAINLLDGVTREFVYLRERADFSVTDITALSATVFLLIERDDGFAGIHEGAATHKRVYRVDVGKATNVNDPANSESGTLFAGRTLEQLTELELQTAGISVATKTLTIDLLSLKRGYPHDKPEGLAVVDGRWLAISNDDDFGIDSDGQGRLIPKNVPGLNLADWNEIYFVPFDE